MSRTIRQPFTPGGKFIASKNFRFHGRAYAKGDEFPWRQLSCSVRKLRQLYEGRYLNNNYLDEEDEVFKEPIIDDLDEDAGDETPEVDEEDENPEVDEDPAGDEEDENPTEPPITIYDPDVHEIVNPDRGEWYIDLDGVHLIQLTAKEAKRLRKKLVSEEIHMEYVIEE